MNTGLIITLSIVIGLASPFTVIALVYSFYRKKLEIIIQNKFNEEDIIGATTKANFFGVKSKGGAQIRGNGALVLTKEMLYFLRAAPQKEYKIPTGAIRQITTPKSFNGKSIFAPLLCVHYETEDGEDSMAWALKAPMKWKEAIESIMGPSRPLDLKKASTDQHQHS